VFDGTFSTNRLLYIMPWSLKLVYAVQGAVVTTNYNPLQSGLCGDNLINSLEVSSEASTDKQSRTTKGQNTHKTINTVEVHEYIKTQSKETLA